MWRVLGALEILVWARRWCPGLGIVTVYRTLERLQSLGLIQRVHGVHNCHSYVAVNQARPFLFLCERCGGADALPSPETEGAVAQVAACQGFRIHAVVLQVSGLCQRCQPGSEPQAGSEPAVKGPMGH